jgi:hypothetical protein
MLISWIFAIPPTYFLRQHHTRACASSQMSLHFTGGIALFQTALSASAFPSYSENTSCPYRSQPQGSPMRKRCMSYRQIDSGNPAHPALIADVRLWRCLYHECSSLSPRLRVQLFGDANSMSACEIPTILSIALTVYTLQRHHTKSYYVNSLHFVENRENMIATAYQNTDRSSEARANVA